MSSGRVLTLAAFLCFTGGMNTEQTQVLEKVRKLLALGRSPSEAEAAAALDKATLLLAKHGLSMAEVQEAEAVQETTLLEKKRLRSWESALVFILCRATFTEALHYRSESVGRILIIGREVNIVTARELFVYLHKLILILGRSYSQEIAHVDSFRQGIVHRIGERLAARAADPAGEQTEAPLSDPVAGPDYAAETRALVVQIDAATKIENRDYIRQTYGATKTRKTGRRVEADSYYRGKAVGDTINLDKQLAGG